MKKTLCLIIISVMIMASFCSCSTSPAKADGLQIVCTAFPQYDYIKNILGNENGLTLLLDDGADLHSYEPTAQDIITIGMADLFIYVGGVSDKWVESTLISANNPSLKKIALMDIVDTVEEEYVAGMEHEHHENIGEQGVDRSEEDEHIWLSLKNAAKITDELCKAICEIDPANAEKYKANADEYIEKLNSLDTEYKLMIDAAKRKTVLFADRFPFRYLVEDYGLTYYAAFAGCSSESEASFETMAFLIDKTKELNLPVILTIEGSDGSIAKMICEETGVRSASINSCQSVSMADIKDGTNYVDIMKNNLEVLREALN